MASAKLAIRDSHLTRGPSRKHRADTGAKPGTENGAYRRQRTRTVVMTDCKKDCPECDVRVDGPTDVFGDAHGRRANQEGPARFPRLDDLRHPHVQLTVMDAKMIELENGDLLRAEVEALVNPVNCVGVMGKGLALQFKNAFPTASRAYARACRSGDLSPGHMHVFELGGPRPRFIIHFPTKRHWRDHARLEDIERGLQALVTEVHTREIRSIAVPALGCGLGGLPWSQVRPLMERALGALDETRVLVFGPQ